MKSAKDNRFLKVNIGVRLTPKVEAVIVLLDSEFEAHGKIAYVTSCIRSEEDQLNTIRGYLAKTGLDKKYPEAIICKLNDKVTVGGEVVYVWQKGWSALLNAGIIINPPIAAKCLMDYFNAEGKNKKGEVIEASPHTLGADTMVFDIGGGTDGIDGDTVSEQKIMQKAITKKLPGIKSVVLERKNNCVHVNCQ